MSNSVDSGSIEQPDRTNTIKMHVNKYIRDVIERYLPAGTNYILFDENMNEIGVSKEDI